MAKKTKKPTASKPRKTAFKSLTIPEWTIPDASLHYYITDANTRHKVDGRLYLSDDGGKTLTPFEAFAFIKTDHIPETFGASTFPALQKGNYEIYFAVCANSVWKVKFTLYNGKESTTTVSSGNPKLKFDNLSDGFRLLKSPIFKMNIV